jgi:hypothetical protein
LFGLLFVWVFVGLLVVWVVDKLSKSVFA